MRFGLIFAVLFIFISCSSNNKKEPGVGNLYLKSEITEDLNYIEWIEPINEYSESVAKYTFNSVPFELMFKEERPPVYPYNIFLGHLDFNDYDKKAYKIASDFNKSLLSGEIDYSLVNSSFSDFFYTVGELVLDKKITGYDIGVPVALPNKLIQVDSILKTDIGKIYLSLFISGEDYKARDVVALLQEI